MSEENIRKFWDEERKRYMVTACEKVGFQHAIAKKTAEFCDREDHVLEAGCGLGYLSLALSSYVSRITAVDADPMATDHLKSMIDNRNPGIDVILNDVFDLPSGMMFDEVVSMSFGSMDKTLDLIRDHCRKRGIVIRKNWEKERFTSALQKENNLSFEEDCAALKAAGADYKVERLTVDMGQPFTDIEDAISFHRAYNKKFDGSVGRKEVMEKLIWTGEDEYPYYMPMKRNLAFIVIESSQLRNR